MEAAAARGAAHTESLTWYGGLPAVAGGAEMRDLQILNSVGRWDEVLKAVQRLRDDIKTWPESSGQEETVEIWNVKEGLLDTGRSAALRLEQWEVALTFNEECIKVTESRGATEVEIAGTRYNDYGPLLELQRYAEARKLLHECLAVFESAAGSSEIGRVHGALADLEFRLQHFREAVRHGSAALRFSYSVGSPADGAIGHFNLAQYLTRMSAERRLVLAHRFAAALIRYQTSDGRLSQDLKALRRDLATLSPSDVPASFDEVCRIVEQTEGVRFRELFSRLPKRATSGDGALRKVLEMVSAEEAEPEMPQAIRALFEAVASGQDVEPMLKALEEQLAGQPQAEEVMAGLRAALAEARRKAQGSGADS